MKALLLRLQVIDAYLQNPAPTEDERCEAAIRLSQLRAIAEVLPDQLAGGVTLRRSQDKTRWEAIEGLPYAGRHPSWADQPSHATDYRFADGSPGRIDDSITVLRGDRCVHKFTIVSASDPRQYVTAERALGVSPLGNRGSEGFTRDPERSCAGHASLKPELGAVYGMTESLVENACPDCKGTVLVRGQGQCMDRVALGYGCLRAGDFMGDISLNTIAYRGPGGNWHDLPAPEAGQVLQARPGEDPPWAWVSPRVQCMADLDKEEPGFGT